MLSTRVVDDRSPNVGIRLALQNTELYLHHRSLSRMDEICDRNVFCVILQGFVLTLHLLSSWRCWLEQYLEIYLESQIMSSPLFFKFFILISFQHCCSSFVVHVWLQNKIIFERDTHGDCSFAKSWW